MTNFPSLVALEDQACNRHPANMLACRFDVHLTTFGNLTQRQLGLSDKQIQYFNPPVVGEALHNPFKLF